MNKMNYLFDACVPHCSTQKRIQRGLESFFAKEEEMHQDWYKRKHPDEVIKDSKNNYNYDDYDYGADYVDYDDYDDEGYGYDYIDDDDNEDDYDYDWI